MSAMQGQEMSHAEFDARYIRPLAPGGLAFHAQLFPGVCGPDLPLHVRIKYHPETAGLPLPRLDAFLGRARSQRIRAERLRVLPNVGQNGSSEGDVQAIIRTLVRGNMLGEVTRVAWYESQIKRLQQASMALEVDDYKKGSEAGIPKGSFWLVRDAGSLAIKAVSYFNYRHNRLNAHDSLVTAVHVPVLDREPSFDPGLTSYVNFWYDVFEDDYQSLSLEEALALDPSEYPRAS